MLNSESVRLRIENEALLGDLARLLITLGHCDWCGSRRREIMDVIKYICEPLVPAESSKLKKRYEPYGKDLVYEPAASK